MQGDQPQGNAELQPTAKIAEGESLGGDAVPFIGRGDFRKERVIEDIGAGEADLRN